LVSAIDATITFSSLFLSSDSMLLETLVSPAIVSLQFDHFSPVCEF